MRLPSGVIGITALLCGLPAACVTSAPSQSAALSQSGLRATATFSQTASDLRTSILQGSASNAFVATWDLCREQPAYCSIRTESPGLSRARLKLAALIGARERAIEALHGAYEALYSEANEDFQARTASAVDNAVATAASYAALAGAPPLPPMAERAAGYGAGLIARQAQAARLRRDNAELAQAVGNIHDAMLREEAIFDSLSEDSVDTNVELETALIQSGLGSSSAALQPLAHATGLNLVGDPDAVLARSPAATTATLATLKAQAVIRASDLTARYAASLAALQDLRDQHLALTHDHPLDLQDIDEQVISLQALLPPASGDRR